MVIVIDGKTFTLNEMGFPYAYGLHSHAYHANNGYVDLKIEKI